MVPLEKLESFMRLLHAVQNVERTARIPNERKWRSTAEHTFELALLAWYIADANDLPLDHEKILKYALAHDLVEAYAGDSYIYDAEAQRTKKARETEALARIAREFDEFPELADILHAYEAREDAESNFVYAADKLIDPLNISLETESSLWKEFDVSFEQRREYKDAKIERSEHVIPYWKALIEKYRRGKDFSSKNNQSASTKRSSAISISHFPACPS